MKKQINTKNGMMKKLIVVGLGSTILASTTMTHFNVLSPVHAANNGTHDGARTTWGIYFNNEGFQYLDGQEVFCIVFGAGAPSGEEMIQTQIGFESDPHTVAILSHGYPANVSGLMGKYGVTKAEAKEATQWAMWATANAYGLPQEVNFTWANYASGIPSKRAAVQGYATELMNLTKAGNVPNIQITVSPAAGTSTYNAATKRLETTAFKASVDSSQPVTFTNLPQDVFAIDMAGNQVTQVQPGQEFKLATNDLTKNTTINNITLNSHVKETAGVVYKSSIPGNQDYIQTSSKDPLKTVAISTTFTAALGDIKFTKIDATTEKALEGMYFDLIDSTGKVIQTARSQKDGSVIFSQILVGNYHVQEKTPTGDGYVNEKEKYPVSIKAGETTDLNGIATVRNVQTETIISKGDATTGKEILGAKLQVLKDGKVVAEWTTNAEGVHSIKKLPAGAYVLREAMPPGRYKFTQDVPFTVKEDGTIAKVKMLDERTAITIEKQHTTTGKRLAGAEFELIDKKTNKQTTMLDEKGNIIPAVAVTDTQGQALFSGVQVGEYFVRELKAPQGYALNKTAIPVSVSNKEDRVQKFFDLGYGKVKFVKIDKTANKPLQGKTFQIKDTNGQVIQSVTSDEKGTVFFQNIIEGDYTVNEVIVTGDGYVDDNTIYPVTVKALNEVDLNGVGVVENTQNKITLMKTDNENNKAVDGAQFDLINENGKIVWSGNGNSEITGIPAGKYTLKETIAPTRYLRNEQSTNVIITEDGKISVGEVKDETRDIVITKISGNTGVPLKGAKFKLKNHDGSDVMVLNQENTLVLAIAVSDDNGIARFRGLPVGEYVVEEIESPVGYARNSDMSVKALENSDATYTYADMKNPEQPAIPTPTKTANVIEKSVLPNTAEFQTESGMTKYALWIALFSIVTAYCKTRTLIRKNKKVN